VIGLSDLTEAAMAAGLSQEQVAAVLPRLKVYLGICTNGVKRDSRRG
jgi:hypothetical protein